VVSLLYVSASEMTYIVSGGALNSTRSHSLYVVWCDQLLQKMWRVSELHDEYRRRGWKQADFASGVGWVVVPVHVPFPHCAGVVLTRVLMLWTLQSARHGWQELETIKNGRLWLRMVVWLQVKVWAQAWAVVQAERQPTSVTHSTARRHCGLWRCIHFILVMYSFFRQSLVTFWFGRRNRNHNVLWTCLTALHRCSYLLNYLLVYLLTYLLKCSNTKCAHFVGFFPWKSSLVGTRKSLIIIIIIIIAQI